MCVTLTMTPILPPSSLVRACLLQGNLLWVFGGVIEAGDKEITLDDLWRLDLVKLDGWHCVIQPSLKREDLVPEEESESEEEEGGGSGGGASDEDDEMLGARALPAPRPLPAAQGGAAAAAAP